jgi:hypothetical protein
MRYTGPRLSAENCLAEFFDLDGHDDANFAGYLNSGEPTRLHRSNRIFEELRERLSALYGRERHRRSAIAATLGHPMLYKKFKSNVGAHVN